MRKIFHTTNLLFTLLIVAGCFPFSLSSQQLIATLSKDTTSVDELASLNISGELTDISSFPDLVAPDGLTIVSRNNNFSLNGINGKIKINQTFTLKASRAGTYTLGPVSVQAGGNRIFSNEVTLTVKNQ